MNCIKPIDMYIKSQKRSIKVPCGKCICCRQTHSRSLAWACQTLFYSLAKHNIPSSFVTLTYSEEHVPKFKDRYTLKKRDFQLFMKRVRKHFSHLEFAPKFKYLACGEYGNNSVLPRPHYHIIFFGIDATVARSLCNLFWSVYDYGMSDCKPASSGAIGYVIKYTTKSATNLKFLYDSEGVEPPFICHSVNLESLYMSENLQRIQDNNYSDNFFGKEFLIPSYYRKKYDVFKNFSPAAYIAAATEQAKLSGFSSLYDFDLHQSVVRARQLIAKATRSGDPVDRPDLPSVFEKSKGLAENALDEIPF